MTLSIPLTLNWWSSTSWWAAATYEDIIDGSLDLYSAQVKNYPVADAFTIWTDTSQEFWWLQWVSARNSQNSTRQWLLSFGIAQWTWNLSRKSIVPMTSNIKEITDGNVRVWFYVGWLDISLDWSYNVAAQEPTAFWITFNWDGTKIYVIWYTNDSIHQYSLTTPYDVTWTVTLDWSYSVSWQEATPTWITFNWDGTKIYVIWYTNDSIYQYSLTTPYDVTWTVTYDWSYSVSSEDSNPQWLTFNDDGTKVYVIGSSNNDIYQYSLTTPYDVTWTVTLDWSYSTILTASWWITFNWDGTKIYIIGSNTDSIHQYSLTTAYDVTWTVTYDWSYSVSSEDSNPQWLTFNDDGTKVYVIGATSDSIHQYSIPPSFNIDCDQTLSVNGTQIYTQNIAGTWGGAYELVDLPSITWTQNPNIDVSWTTIWASTIVFEASTTVNSNPSNFEMKLWFGLTWWDFTTPTWNYETSTLDLLL